MGAATKQAFRKEAAVAKTSVLPRVLFITAPHRKGGWLADSLGSGRGGEAILDDALGMTAGLARLRDEAYDLVLINHEPGDLDALEFIRAKKGAGSDEPVIVFGEQSEQQMAAQCYEAGADAYVCINTVTTRTLHWMALRAMERHRLQREHRALSQAEHNRLRMENSESRRMLAELGAVSRDLHAMYLQSLPGSPLHAETTDLSDDLPSDDVHLPLQLVAHYRDLLRAYVIMGSGNLAKEVTALAELLSAAGVSARQALTMHLEVVEALVAGLGNRSTRHVMTRADLLLLEVTVHLAEGYRRRYRERQCPPQQMLLPGFDSATAPVHALAS